MAKKKTIESGANGANGASGAGTAKVEGAKAAETPAPAAAAHAVVTTASPLADRVAQAVALIQAAIALLALQAPALTAAQRMGMNRPRKGGDKLIPQIAQIAQTWAVQIRTQPTAAMTSAMQLVTTLQPLIGVLVGFLQEAQDVGFQAESDSWSTASALYAVLKRMSRKDPKLQAQLAPIAEFFAYRHPVVRAAAAAKETKPGKEARRKAKEVTQAEALVAAQPSAAAAPTPAGASGPATAPAAHA